MLAGYTFWFPKAFGFRLDERWGRISAYCWIFGWMGAFFPLYILGLMGLPRRSVAYEQTSYVPLEIMAFIGALLVAAALMALMIQLWVSIKHREANRVFVGDPWDGRSLEWATSAPPPEYNFPVIPHINDRDAFTAAKEFGMGYQEPDTYVDIEVPQNSAIGPVFGGTSFLLAFGLVWHIWWLVILMGLLTLGILVAHGFQRDTLKIIPAETVCQTHQRWIQAAQSTQPIKRSQEHTAMNKGRAALETVEVT